MEFEQILKAVRDNFEYLGDPTAGIEQHSVDWWDEPIVRIRNNNVVIRFNYDRRDRVLLPSLRTIDVQRQYDNATRDDIEGLIDAREGVILLLIRRGLNLTESVSIHDEASLSAWMKNLFVAIRDHGQDILTGDAFTKFPPQKLKIRIWGPNPNR